MGCFCVKSNQPAGGVIKASFIDKNLIKGKNFKSGNDIEVHNTIYIKSLYHKRKNYLYVISPNNWLNVIDFLDYRELRECGKMNRTMNYLVKNSKVLVKFFINKKYMTKSKDTNKTYVSHFGKDNKIEAVNISIYGNNTVLSLPSFANKDVSSFYSGNIPNSSNSQQSSSGQNTNTLKIFTLLTNPPGKFLKTLTINTLKTSDNLIKNHSLSNHVSNHPGFYSDFFTQNQIDWNIVRKDIINCNFKTSVSADHTPSFSKKSDESFQSHYSLFNIIKRNTDPNANSAQWSFLMLGKDSRITQNNFVKSSTYANTPTSTSTEISLRRVPFNNNPSNNIMNNFPSSIVEINQVRSMSFNRNRLEEEDNVDL